MSKQKFQQMKNNTSSLMQEKANQIRNSSRISVSATSEKSVENTRESEQIEKTKTGLIEEIEIPSGISTEIKDDILIMRKENKELKRKLTSVIKTRIEGNKVILSSDKNRKIEKTFLGTFNAHVRNMIEGLEDGFRFKLQVSNVHFPMNVSFDKVKNALVVKNFLGEKVDRIITVPKGVDIKVDKGVIEIESHDIEKAGDAATRIEKGTRVRNRDRRVFQDGIFIINKPGRAYL